MRILVLDGWYGNVSAKGALTGGVTKVALQLAENLPGATLFCTPSEYSFSFPTIFSAVPYIGKETPSKEYKSSWLAQIASVAEGFDVLINNSASEKQIALMGELKSRFPHKKVLNYYHTSFLNNAFTSFAVFDALAKAKEAGVRNVAVSDFVLWTAEKTLAEKQKFLKTRSQIFDSYVHPFCFTESSKKETPRTDSVVYVSRLEREMSPGSAVNVLRWLKRHYPFLKQQVYTVKAAPEKVYFVEKALGEQIFQDRPFEESNAAIASARFLLHVAHMKSAFPLVPLEAASVGTPTLMGTGAARHPMDEAFPPEYSFQYVKKGALSSGEAELRKQVERLLNFTDHSGLRSHMAEKFSREAFVSSILTEVEKA